MFAVGHLALGHICGSTTSQALKTNLNLPLVLVLSTIPDIDILIPQLQHRGPTHSIITATILFIPLFIIYKKKALPYFAALTQHFLIGDLMPGGRVQLFWPISMQYYGRETSITDPTNMTAEWILFTISILIMLRTNQITKLFKPRHSNLLLTIPVVTVLMPTLIGYPLNVPIEMIPPHLIYTAIFSTAIILSISKILTIKKKNINHIHTIPQAKNNDKTSKYTNQLRPPWPTAHAYQSTRLPAQLNKNYSRKSTTTRLTKY